MPTNKPSKWENFKNSTGAKLGQGAMSGYTIYEIGRHLLGLKHGGRVRGVGKATHGYGKAMKKGKK